eukprot:scaffold21415_cov57-Cyclotella_meneghiniana.AAC.1
MQDVGVGVSFRLRWMTQTDIVDEIYDGGEISTMFVIMAASESITLSLLYIDRRDIVVEERVLAEGAMRCCLEAAADFDKHMLHVFLAGRTCSRS